MKHKTCLIYVSRNKSWKRPRMSGQSYWLILSLIPFHFIPFFFLLNICNQWPLTFSIYHWYQIKSRSSEISQIKLTLLLLFLLFAEHKGISSNGTIHNIMADGIFIQNSMIAKSVKLWGEYINCLTITTKRTVFLILLDQGKWIFLSVYWRIL